MVSTVRPVINNIKIIIQSVTKLQMLSSCDIIGFRICHPALEHFNGCELRSCWGRMIRASSLKLKPRNFNSKYIHNLNSKIEVKENNLESSVLVVTNRHQEGGVIDH